MTETSPSSAPLAGLLVLDLTDDRGEMAGLLLSDLGAEVLKIEPPGGVNSRARAPFDEQPVPSGELSLYWSSVGLGKKSVVVDLTEPSGVRSLLDLADRADVLIESFAPGRMSALGLSYERLKRSNPGLIYAAITPFGQTGPKAHWLATDLTLEAAGGLVGLQGDRDRPPVPVGLPQAAFHAGAQAAADIIVALNDRATSGLGQFLDVSTQAAVIWTLMHATGFPPNTGGDPPGTGETRSQPVPELVPGVPVTPRVWETRDGAVMFTPSVGAIGPRSLHAFVRWMEEEGQLKESLCGRDWRTWPEDVRQGALPAAAANELFVEAGSFIRSKTMRELLDRALKDSILIAPIYTTADLLADPQLEARGYWVTIGNRVHPGDWVKLSRTPLRTPEPAPAVGSGQARLPEILKRPPKGRLSVVPPDVRRPFAGVKIADFFWIGAGPMVTKQMADHGASVVHVESSLHPDVLRMGQPAKDGIPGIDRSQFMANFNTSKLGLALDLWTEGGRELARKLIAWADIVTESFTPGTMARFGLDWETLRKDRPDLIMVSSCLRGQTGPERAYGGFGGQGAAVAGLHSITGWPDRKPDGPWGAYTDFIAPRYTLAAVAAAVLDRRRTGKGQYIDLSQVEAGIHFMEPLVLDYTVNGRVARAPGFSSLDSCPHGVYRCSGVERYVAIEARSEAHWRALCGVPGLDALGRLGGPTFAERKAVEPAINAAIGAWCASRDAFGVEAELVAAGVPAAAVQRPSDLYRDPQLAHRNFFVTCNHTVMGPTPYDGPVTIFSDTPAKLTAAPCLGEHSEQVLQELLGLPDEMIQGYAEQGVFT